MSIPLGFKHTAEARMKISLGNKGKVVSEETRQKIATAKRGVGRPEEMKVKVRGENNGQWKGGITYSDGYRFLNVGPGKRKKEHRLVMERYLGRPLSPDEHVHHIDGNKLNNDISNLQIMDAREHGYEHLLKLTAELDELRKFVVRQDAIISELLAKITT